MSAWHGYGRLLYNKFGTYEGQFDQNCFKGQGKFTDFATGEVKEGEFWETKQDMGNLYNKMFPQIMDRKKHNKLQDDIQQVEKTV